MPEQNLQFDARHAVTVVYSAAVSKYRFVNWVGAHSTDAADVQGISELAGPAGKAGSLVTSYSYLVEAAAAIPAGSLVAPSGDGTGRAVVAASGSCGRAITAAAAAGELLTVVLRLGGGAVSEYGIALPAPSGDTTGATDSANIEAAILLATLGRGRMYVPLGEYILKRDLRMVSGLHIRMAPGAVLRTADSFTLAVTAASTDTVTVADTSRVDIQMHVLDAAADLAAGNALGCTPGDLRVIAKTATTIQFSAPLTAGGAQTLRFYSRGNVITADRAIGWSLACPGGWAYLDGNRPHVYPYAIGGNDSVGNAVRIRSCSAWDIDGICGRNTRYHGLIAVGQNFDHRVGRFRGTNNGYRALHYHTENLDGVTNGEVSRGHIEYVEADTTGVLAYQSQGSEENNSGVFLALDNVAGITVGTIRSREAHGAAVMLSGTVTSGISASNNNTIGAIYSENAAITLGLYRELRNLSVPTITGRGKYVQLTGCATLDAADLTWYYMPNSGTQSTYAVRRVQIPAGSIVANNIRAGHRLFMSAGTTGMAGGGLQIIKADIGTGAGGTDILWVFRDGGTANPYTTVASGFALHIWTCRGTAFFMDEASTKQIKGIKIGAMTLEWAGRSAIGMTASASEVRYRDISIGSLTIDGVAAACTWASVAGLTIGHYLRRNQTNGLPDAGSTQTGGPNTLFSNCANVTLPAVYSDFTLASGADNCIQWRFDANCRNVAMSPRGLHPSASAATIDVVVPSGAAANTAGFAGPVVLTDPRTKAGAQIAVSATGIVRVDATACLIVRPTDTP